MILSLKGQCVGIKAMQSCVISQIVISLLNVILQEFAEFIINKLERPSKLGTVRARKVFVNTSLVAWRCKTNT